MYARHESQQVYEGAICEMEGLYACHGAHYQQGLRQRGLQSGLLVRGVSDVNMCALSLPMAGVEEGGGDMF